jgi:hypothetical protein
MKKHIFGLLILFTILAAPATQGLSLITAQNPFADIDKLGTVIKPGESITIQNTNGTVTIEYVAPTKRRIIWNGESREISLLKSSLLNGIYSDRTKLEPSPIADIHGAAYCERTIIFENEADLKAFTSRHSESPRFENRTEKQMRLYFEIGEKGRGKEAARFFFIQIIRYRLGNNELAE